MSSTGRPYRMSPHEWFSTGSGLVEKPVARTMSGSVAYPLRASTPGQDKGPGVATEALITS
jgi:hypothetical protein